MTNATLKGFSMVSAAMSDTRTFTASEAHLGKGHKFQNPDTFTTPDGAKFVWSETRRLYVRGI